MTIDKAWLETDAHYLVNKARVNLELEIEQQQQGLISTVVNTIATSNLCVLFGRNNLATRRNIRRLRALGFTVNLDYDVDWVDSWLFNIKPRLVLRVTLPFTLTPPKPE